MIKDKTASLWYSSKRLICCNILSDLSTESLKKSFRTWFGVVFKDLHKVIKVDKLTPDLVDSISFKNPTEMSESSAKVSCVNPDIALADFIFLLNTNFTSSSFIYIIYTFSIIYTKCYHFILNRNRGYKRLFISTQQQKSEFAIKIVLN